VDELPSVELALPQEPFEVYEKLDGSLGILYWVDDEPRVATRGSFTGVQAQRGTAILRARYGHVAFRTDVTYLFEILFPENRIVVDYGGGRLTVRPATSIGVLLEGTFTGPPEISVRRDGDRVEAQLRPKRGWRPPWGPGTTWSLGLSRDIPLSLAFHVGAASSDIDLAEVRAEDVEIQTGASQTTLAVPSRGRSTVRVHGGAADFRIRIPDGVAASIRTRTGMASVRVDPRFPRVDGGYRTLGFDEAPNRVELDVDVGAASVQVL